MADLIIPSPDASGYWHFTYVTTDSLDGRWYGGKRSTKRHPLSDRYLGSGNWIRAHPARERLRREIIAFFANSAEVYEAETLLVTWDDVFDNPFCMNERPGGNGMTVEFAKLLHATPDHHAKIVSGVAKRSSNQTWRKNHTAAMQRVTATPEWRDSQLTGSRKRSADPKWLEANTANARRLATEPYWQKAHSTAMQAMISRPDWKQICAARLAKRNANPVWRVNVGSAATKSLSRMRAANPNWRDEQIAENKRMAADPVWQAAVAAGLARRNANPTWKANVGASNQARTTIFVNLNGKRMSLRDACCEVGISYQTAFARKAKSVPESQWLTPPSKRRAGR